MTTTALTEQQRDALSRLCERYGATFDASEFHHPFDLPQGWVAGWVVSGNTGQGIYVGCSPEGDISS